MDGGLLMISYFFAAFATAILLNFFLLKFLKNTRSGSSQPAKPSFVRWASKNKPLVGGWSFFALFLLTIAVYFLLPDSCCPPPSSGQFTALVGSCVLGFVVGLADDAREMPPFFKFLGQLACSGVVLAMGLYIPISGVYWLDAIFTIVWIVGIMNSINMLDNMDGISASVSVGILLACLLVLPFGESPNQFLAFLLVGMLAALAAYLVFNRHPAKMFMGDSGSQFLGAFLAVAGIIVLWRFGGGEAGGGFRLERFVLPVVAFLPTIADTATVTFRRIGRGVSPFTGGRDHTTHHLAYCGLSEGAVMYVFAGWALLSAGLCALLAWLLPAYPMACTIFAAVYALSLFGLVQWLYGLGGAREQERQKKAAVGDLEGSQIKLPSQKQHSR